MLKAVYPVLALLALLIAAMAGDWNVAPTAARAFAHDEHAPSLLSTSVDDDGDEGDDALVTSLLAAPADDDDDDDDAVDGEGDWSALPDLAGVTSAPPPGAADAVSMTCRGLRASGEHRASSERPPRV